MFGLDLVDDFIEPNNVIDMHRGSAFNHKLATSL
jgi:hypothetical protein